LQLLVSDDDDDDDDVVMTVCRVTLPSVQIKKTL
jgi:hypothetical protein